MGRSIQDILDSKNPDDIESVKDWTELSKSRNSVDLSWHDLDSLKGIENLPNANIITSIHLNNNNLTSLVELAKLPALYEFWFSENPCFNKYRKLNGTDISSKTEILNYIKNIESHLNPDDELRGKAAAIDSGLFDFNIK